MEQLKSRIEAVLFVTAKVLQISDIAEILEEEPENILNHSSLMYKLPDLYREIIDIYSRIA